MNEDPVDKTVWPVGLEKTVDRNLVIEWNDQKVQRIPFRLLRNSCLCAVCNAKREQEKKQPAVAGGLPVISAAEAQPLDIVKMHPVGNYAYSIHFSDGHSSGIYTFEMLRSLA